jgi:hypothetical protein
MKGRIAFFAIALALGPCSVAAQEHQDCQAFRDSSGTAIVFKPADPSQQYAVQIYEDAADRPRVPYELIAGRKGKVVGGRPDQYGISYYHEVLLDDCRTVLWFDSNERLEADDERIGVVEFADRPTTVWSIREESDRLTDVVSCAVTPEAEMPYPMFLYRSDGRFSIGVVGGDFPGRPVTLRVDSNRALSENDGLSQGRAFQVVEQIRRGGKRLLVGSYEWPKDYEVVREFNLSGIVEQLDRCKRHIRR